VGGVTWTEVTISSVDDMRFPEADSMFNIGNKIWLGASTGYIFFSDDGGTTWTAQTEATVTVNDINGVCFINENEGMAVGDLDTVLYTNDGGTTWSAVSGTGNASYDLITIEYSDGFWWTGGNKGYLYYSSDNGTTWTRREFANDGASAVGGLQGVRNVKFLNSLFGMMAWEQELRDRESRLKG